TGSPALTASTVGTCSATVTVRATDECGNYAEVTYSTRIDNGNPTVTKTSIAACYPTAADAEAAAIAATSAMDNCTGSPALTASTVGTCSATVTVRATDECGNYAEVTYSARIDNGNPTVTKTSIAACYPTAADAEDRKSVVTGNRDNCTGSPAFTASTVGTCSATVTVRATDECGNYAEVTYSTRIDNGNPTVTK